MLGAEEGSDDGKSLTEGCEDGRLLGDVLIDGDSVNWSSEGFSLLGVEDG